MEKRNYYKLLYGVSIVLILGFCIRLTADYYQYNAITNSAPFYVWIIVRSIEFLVPSAIAYIVGIVVKKKFNAQS